GYARFRAVMAARGCVWGRWPERLRAGRTTPEDGRADVYRTFLYAQWRLSGQLDEVATRAKHHGPGLYLDLPLGVHPDGYDAWHEQDAFMAAMGVGAPPDDFFTQGQSWGFAPLHPRHIRERGYAYLSACLRSQLARAGMLRIDHVMWLHRLYCIPDGMEATEGAYVRYRPEEMYAVLALESQRHRSAIVGEDLGTVPDEVRQSMADKGVLRMYVLQFEAGPEGLGEVPRDCVASLNTHDMPPFAAWWGGQDVDDRVELGFLDPPQAEVAHDERAQARDRLRRHLGVGRPGGDPDEDVGQVVQAALEWLAESPARVVLVNAEDLWLERRPQNVPGTGPERPNWRGKAKLTVEQMQLEDNVITCLHGIDERRRA
ncbi:MAG: 4-alpha-glucanotransferase, partial [Myxococcota bacterium]